MKAERKWRCPISPKLYCCYIRVQCRSLQYTCWFVVMLVNVPRVSSLMVMGHVKYSHHPRIACMTEINNCLRILIYVIKWISQAFSFHWKGCSSCRLFEFISFLKFVSMDNNVTTSSRTNQRACDAC